MRCCDNCQALRSTTDASANVISAQTRFDAAYKAIMQLAMAARHAKGYRTLTGKPSHHQTAIQGLVHSIDLKNDPVWTIDPHGQQRHLNDYAGAMVPEILNTDHKQTPFVSCHTIVTKII
jgi:hypothetical protein